jgi:hypothetical protein
VFGINMPPASAQFLTALVSQLRAPFFFIR